MMKYIRFKNAGMVVFSDNLIHKDVADRFPDDEALSAGSFAMLCEENHCHTFGESTTLFRGSRKVDGELFHRMTSVY